MLMAKLEVVPFRVSLSLNIYRESDCQILPYDSTPSHKLKSRIWKHKFDLITLDVAQQYELKARCNNTLLCHSAVCRLFSEEPSPLDVCE